MAKLLSELDPGNPKILETLDSVEAGAPLKSEVIVRREKVSAFKIRLGG